MAFPAEHFRFSPPIRWRPCYSRLSRRLRPSGSISQDDMAESSDTLKRASLFELANPRRFLDVSAAVLPWIGSIAALSIAAGLFLALFVAPPDYRQGQTVKIMFIHVPAAWIAMMAYGAMAIASLFGLVNRHPLADVAAKTAAPL